MHATLWLLACMQSAHRSRMRKLVYITELENRISDTNNVTAVGGRAGGSQCSSPPVLFSLLVPLPSFTAGPGCLSCLVVCRVGKQRRLGPFSSCRSQPTSRAAPQGSAPVLPYPCQPQPPTSPSSEQGIREEAGRLHATRAGLLSTVQAQQAQVAALRAQVSMHELGALSLRGHGWSVASR